MNRRFALLGALFLACGSTGAVFAQQVVQTESQGTVIRGTVLDENGQPIIGASISEVGTNRGASTALDGTFSLRTAGKGKLQVSYVGYKTLTVEAKPNMTINLQPDNVLMRDVVVVGYGQQKKANLTGAVATVDVNKSLTGRQIADVGRGLQGTTAGLNIVMPNGEVGSDPTIKIRGAIASLNGSAKPLILLDNVEIPSIQVVNPEDVASISVLKDAAAASIYGAKAAFGVILITTKKGASTESIDVSYSGNFAWESIAKPKEMAGVDGIAYRVDALKRVGATDAGYFWTVDQETLDAAREWQQKYGNTIGPDDPFVYGRDWWMSADKKLHSKRIFDPNDYMFRQAAPSMSHNFNVSGRSGSTSYAFGLGYLDQSGITKPAKHDDFRRYNASARISTNLNKWVTARVGFNYSMRNKRYPYTTSATFDPWLYLYRWDTTYPLGYDENGQLMRSPYGEMKYANTGNKQDSYLGINLGTTLNLTDDWHVNVDYTYASEDEIWNRPGTKYAMANSWAKGDALVPRVDANGNPVYVNSDGQVVDANSPGAMRAYNLPFLQYTADGANPDHIYRYVENAKRHTWNITTDYNWDLNEDNNFKFMLGANIVDWEMEWNSSRNYNLTDIINPSFTKTAGKQESDGGTNWDGQIGWFGRINYALKSRYLIEANLRHDATSKFPGHMRWRLYPSFSAGWRVSEEAFMAWARPTLSNLKLRGSWGLIGDQSVSNALYVPTMNQGQTNWLSGNTKLIYVGTPKAVYADITWQDIRTTDFGVDLGLFNSQLNVTFDWFQRETRNMIVPQEGIPATFGASAPSGNFGNLRTRGWELLIDFNHRFENGLGVNATFTLSDAKTKITKYGSGRNIDSWYDGKTYGEIWGYETDRLYQKDDFVWDANGNIVTTWALNGREVPAGTPGARLVNKLSDPNGVYQDLFEGNNFRFGPGDVKFKDLDGDGQIWYGTRDSKDAENTVENHGDKKVIGNSTPRFEYGFRLGADYRGFDVSLFFQGIGKRSIWGAGPLAIPGWYVADGAMPQAIAGDYWTESNTDAFYPRPFEMKQANTGYNMQVQSRYLLDMSYLRLKNVTIGYTLPTTISKKAYLSKARIYVAAENLFIIDHLRGLPIDPEVITGVSMFLDNGNYNLGRTGVGAPAMRNISVGVQLNF